MDDYIHAAKSQLLCGIQAGHWLSFFKAFQERKSSEDIARALARMTDRMTAIGADEGGMHESIRTILGEMEKMVGLLADR